MMATLDSLTCRPSSLGILSLYFSPNPAVFSGQCKFIAKASIKNIIMYKTVYKDLNKSTFWVIFFG